MTQFNEAQHLAMLEEISVSAMRVVELSQMIQGWRGDEVDARLLASAIERTAQHVGWMANAATKAHLGVLPELVLNDPWNMPPMVVAEGRGNAATGGAAP